MKPNELKRVLKPLIKECIKEVIFEEGVLSGIISEVVKGTHGVVLQERQENHKKEQKLEEKNNFLQKKQVNKKLNETKKRMLDSIGQDAYGGIDVFEGTSPLSSAQAGLSEQNYSPLSDVSANDPGIDISSYPGSNVWSKLIK